MPVRLATALQYVLPKRALTSLVGRAAAARGGAATTAVIRWFIGRYGVDMSEAADPAADHYATFNDFFTRALRPGARPLAGAPLLCPVDGAVSQLGPIDGSHIVQAKRHRYTAQALLGGDARLAERFAGGHFATLYLSPRDYHRIHMPCAARLLRMVHVPGDLFSVNQDTVAAVPGLFARNERVVCCFEAAFGPFVLVLVGATIVGSMATVWHGVINPPRPGRVREWRYEDRDLRLEPGDEMGRFLLGSTVVLLFPPLPLRFNAAWAPGATIRLGEAMASFDR